MALRQICSMCIKASRPFRCFVFLPLHNVLGCSRAKCQFSDANQTVVRSKLRKKRTTVMSASA